MNIRLKERSLIYRLLTVKLYQTDNQRKAAKSKFEYGYDGDRYFLRPLGILHHLIGLTIVLEE
jgi:hypothetical protein